MGHPDTNFGPRQVITQKKPGNRYEVQDFCIARGPLIGLRLLMHRSAAKSRQVRPGVSLQAGCYAQERAAAQSSPSIRITLPHARFPIAVIPMQGTVVSVILPDRYARIDQARVSVIRIDAAPVLSIGLQGPRVRRKACKPPPQRRSCCESLLNTNCSPSK
jgi:hypothetical protein